jgi:hypothetical protein
MQFMSSWAADDKRTLLHFSKATLETFCLHVQASDSDCEAGGLLLGSVHGAHMLIEQATVPTAWDKRFRYLFDWPAADRRHPAPTGCFAPRSGRSDKKVRCAAE